MAHEILRCRNCKREMDFERYNARFGNQGYMYCDTDATIVTWSSYDPMYSRLSENSHPWMLDAGHRAVIEQSVISCPSGGHFSFSATPRCPYCLAELPELSSDPTYFVVLAERIDGERSSVWRTPTE